MYVSDIELTVNGYRPLIQPARILDSHDKKSISRDSAPNGKCITYRPSKRVFDRMWRNGGK